MQTFDLSQFSNVVFFIGAGMSAESGMPTYRGPGGVWNEYRYEEYACQEAFEQNPEKVLDFHVVRRTKALSCLPHAGHVHLAALQARYPQVQVITQNIDGLLQRAGIQKVVELHGSLWRQRCSDHGITEDTAAGEFKNRQCPLCGEWLRPDITWFGDSVDEERFIYAESLIRQCSLFVSIGTSGVVWPAASLVRHAVLAGAHRIEINPTENAASDQYHLQVREPASEALVKLFPLGA